LQTGDLCAQIWSFEVEVFGWELTPPVQDADRSH
jgi:hypothetical protein